MTRSGRVVPVAAIVGLAGCHLVFGIHELDRGSGGSTSGGSGGEPEAGPDGVDSAALPPGCTLPASGRAFARVGNLIPSRQRVDFCLRPAAKTSWTDVYPVIQSSGADCPKGLGYKEVSAAFGMASGLYDAKLIVAGESCEAAGLTGLGPTAIEDEKTVALYAFGDNTAAPMVRPFAESRSTSPSDFVLRFVHAAPDLGPLDVGYSDSEKLPARLTAVSFASMSFGSTSPAGSSPAGKIDENGHVQIQLAGGVLLLGASPAGTAQASLVLGHTFDRSAAHTAFVVGTESRPEFPTELWTCDEVKVSGPLAKCGNGVSRDVKVDVVNLQLTGPFIHYFSARRDRVPAPVAQLGSDFVCVTETWSDSDKEAIVNASKAEYPHSFFAKHDWTTKIDDPSDAHGNTPPTPTKPPCWQSLGDMTTTIDCVRDYCATPAGSDEGVPVDDLGNCMTKSCGSAGAIQLMTGTPDDKACWSCLFTQLASGERISFIRSACSSNPNARFAFRGADGILMLSRRPISSPEVWVLPATEWRVSIYRAPITLDNGANLDAYCTVLTTPASSCLTRPYTGQYGGDGKDCVEQWANELILQSGKLVNWVRAKSTALKTKAVIAGEFYSGPGLDDGAANVIKARHPSAYEKLAAAFALAVPEGYVPKCTFCADNPIVSPPGTPPAGESTWTTSVFLSNIPITMVRSAEITLRDPVVSVSVPGDAGTLMIPVSTYYGFRSVVGIEP
jgi:hypothetical protein